MNDKNIGELVVRLFESKCRTYSETTIKVWVEELKELDVKYLSFAIKKAIRDKSNFPSIGQILEFIEDSKKDIGKQLMLKTDENTLMIAKEAGVNLEKYNSGQFDMAANERCVERFMKVYDKKMSGDTKEIPNKVEPIDDRVMDLIKKVGI